MDFYKVVDMVLDIKQSMRRETEARQRLEKTVCI
jgi:hypothetical protein